MEFRRQLITIRHDAARLRSIVASSLLCMLAAGCGDDGPDLVTIRTVHPPAMIAFREEVDPQWQLLPTSGAATFDIATTGPYRVVIACEIIHDLHSIGITEYARNPEDGSSLEHACGIASYPFRIVGDVTDAGEVFFGGFGRGSFPGGWTFDLPAAAGTFDLVLLAGDFTAGFERIGLRRDVAITNDTDLGLLDLAEETTHALVATPFTVSNLRADESLITSTRLDTGSTFASLQSLSDSGPPRLAPDAALRATDRQRVLLSAVENASGGDLLRRSRSVEREVRVGDATTATLPEPIGPVSFEMSSDRLAATWSTLPDCDEVVLTRTSFPPSRQTSHRIVLSRNFIGATGAASAVLDLSAVPGFKREWGHDPMHDQTRVLAASRGPSTDRSSASVSERVEPAPPSPATSPAVIR